MVRKNGFIDRSDYEGQFLRLLNKATKSGLSQALFQEKLGWHDQRINYVQCAAFLTLPSLSLNLLTGTHGALSFGLAFLTIGNITSNCVDHYKIRLLQQSEQQLPLLPPYLHNRDWKWLWLPLIPIEKLVGGRYFLARHGDNLIIPKED